MEEDIRPIDRLCIEELNAMMMRIARDVSEAELFTQSAGLIRKIELLRDSIALVGNTVPRALAIAIIRAHAPREKKMTFQDWVDRVAFIEDVRRMVMH